MKRWLMVVAVVGCEESDTVRCGTGTFLKDGVCEVAAPTPAAAPPAQDAVAKALANTPPPPRAGGWQYQENKDEMRGAITKLASLRSSNANDFSPPYGRAVFSKIILRRGDKGSRHGLDAYLMIERGQFDCSSYDGCRVSYKFDDADVAKWSMSSGTDTDAIFFNQPAKFLEKLKTSKRLMVEAEFFREGVRQYTFDVSGLTFD